MSFPAQPGDGQITRWHWKILKQRFVGVETVGSSPVSGDSLGTNRAPSLSDLTSPPSPPGGHPPHESASTHGATLVGHQRIAGPLEAEDRSGTRRELRLFLASLGRRSTYEDDPIGVDQAVTSNVLDKEGTVRDADEEHCPFSGDTVADKLTNHRLDKGWVIDSLAPWQAAFAIPVFLPRIGEHGCKAYFRSTVVESRE
jgi:hypothetical protein